MLRNRLAKPSEGNELGKVTSSAHITSDLPREPNKMPEARETVLAVVKKGAFSNDMLSRIWD